MKLLNSRKVHSILALILSFIIATALLLPAYAYDSVEDLEDTTSDLENELSGLTNELETLDAELDYLISELNTVSADIEHAKTELSIAKGNAQTQYETMKKRIRYMYESGSTNYLEVLFSATSMADLLSRAEYISMINQRDRQLYEELDVARKEVEEKEALLLEKQESLNVLKEELAQKEAALNEQISATSSELASYKEKLAQAKEEAQKADESAKEEVIPVIPQPEEPVSPEPDTQEPIPSVPDTSETPDEDTPVINPTSSDVELLAALIECEAGSTDYEGMLAVGSVVVNRMKNRHYPDTLRGVIYQSGQFSPVKSGKLDLVLARGVKSSCVQAAQDALAGKNNVGDCLSFRAASSGHAGTIIGDNVFF